MSETNHDQLIYFRNIAIVTYTLCGIALVAWTLLLIRIVATKAGLHVLTLICVLLIVYQLLCMAFGQYIWTEEIQDYRGIKP